MSEMIERVAEAMWTARQEAHGHYPDDGPWASQVEMVKDWVRAEVRAAIEAMREPTKAMELAGDLKLTWAEVTYGPDEIWRAMVDEALK